MVGAGHLNHAHRKINNILTVLVVGLGFYLVLSPVLPSLDFWWRKRTGFDVPAYAESTNTNQTPPEDIPKDNRLAIPSIGIDEVIIDSNNPNAVDKGVLRQPKTSKPPLGSNTVLIGHRFSYSPSIKFPFYNLDKVALGDSVVVAWEGVVYRYKVTEVKVVEPTEIAIEAPTEDARLTLYTCTPLWTAEKRLVIIAKPILEDQ